MGNCLTVEAASADIKNLKVVAEISCSGLHTSKTEVVNIFERWKTQTFKRVNGQTLCAMTHFLTDQEFFWPEGGTLLHWVASLSGSIGGLVILEALESVGVLTPEIVNLPARCIAHRPFSQDPEWPQCVKEAPFQTAITFAIGYGRRGTHEQPRIAEMVAILIKAGATGASRLIHLAVRAGVPTVELLLKNGATLEQRDANQNTPLICACSSDSPLSVVQYLVKQGAKVNVCNHHPKFVPLTPLIATLRSTLSNLFDILETLLSAGADANFTPNGSPPPLYVAMDCHCRKIEIIGRLIKAGADVNAASAGSSPLGKAISMFQYSPELFLFILEAGAKITDDAIFHAAATSAVVIEELLKRGANINITRSGDGQTPLHNAACYGKEDCVVALLKAGANVTAKCAKGLMPLDCATTFQIRTILESALAEKLFRQTQYQEQQKILLLQQQLDTQHKLLALLSSKPAESSPTKLPTSRFNVYSEEQLTYNSIVIAPEEYKPAISCVEELKQNVLPLFISLVPKFPDMLAECPLILSSVQESPQVKDMVMSCSLTSDELFAIIAYTYDVRSANIEDNFYFQLNKCLRARQTKELNAIKGFMYYLMSGLRKLPPHNGIVYRGTVSPEIIKKEYYQGREIYWSSFSSTSKDEEVAKRFSGHEGVVFKIKVMNAKDISYFSAFAEKEVLLPPNSGLFVSKALYEKNRTLYVQLVEKTGHFRW